MSLPTTELVMLYKSGKKIVFTRHFKIYARIRPINSRFFNIHFKSVKKKYPEQIEAFYFYSVHQEASFELSNIILQWFSFSPVLFLVNLYFFKKKFKSYTDTDSKTKRFQFGTLDTSVPVYCTYRIPLFPLTLLKYSSIPVQIFIFFFFALNN